MTSKEAVAFIRKEISTITKAYEKKGINNEKVESLFNNVNELTTTFFNALIPIVIKDEKVISAIDDASREIFMKDLLRGMTSFGGYIEARTKAWDKFKNLELAKRLNQKELEFIKFYLLETRIVIDPANINKTKKRTKSIYQEKDKALSLEQMNEFDKTMLLFEDIMKEKNIYNQYLDLKEQVITYNIASNEFYSLQKSLNEYIEIFNMALLKARKRFEEKGTLDSTMTELKESLNSLKEQLKGTTDKRSISRINNKISALTQKIQILEAKNLKVTDGVIRSILADEKKLASAKEVMLKYGRELSKEEVTDQISVLTGMIDDLEQSYISFNNGVTENENKIKENEQYIESKVDDSPEIEVVQRFIDAIEKIKELFNNISIKIEDYLEGKEEPKSETNNKPTLQTGLNSLKDKLLSKDSSYKKKFNTLMTIKKIVDLLGKFNIFKFIGILRDSNFISTIKKISHNSKEAIDCTLIEELEAKIGNLMQDLKSGKTENMPLKLKQIAALINKPALTELINNLKKYVNDVVEEQKKVERLTKENIDLKEQNEKYKGLATNCISAKKEVIKDRIILCGTEGLDIERIVTLASLVHGVSDTELTEEQVKTI